MTSREGRGWSDLRNPYDRTAAILSAEVYKGVPNRMQAVFGWRMVQGTQNSSTGVWYNSQLNNYLVAFRGTKLSDAADLHADRNLYRRAPMSIARFQQWDRYLQNTLQNLRNENPYATFTFTGHSLGSSGASYFASKYGGNSILFSSPRTWRPQQGYTSLEYHLSKDFANAIRRFGGAIGQSYKTEDIITQSDRVVGSHSIDNYQPYYAVE